MIHEHKNGHWWPGDARREGCHTLPAHPGDQRFFNDVTGLSGATAEAVVQPLADLLMRQAPLAGLLPRPVDWAGFMARLQTAVTRVNTPDREIGRVWVKPDESLEVWPASGLGAALLQEAAQLALALVRANGQLDFVRRQAWFQDGSHRLVLVIEQQFDRTTPWLIFHQDTSGCALFSNLMFLNTAGLPAPEWSPNLEGMPPGKRSLVNRLWPPALLATIDAERERLIAQGRAWHIEGGTLPANGCVCWTDELIWHSTPFLASRSTYTRDLVRELLLEPAFDEFTFDLLMQVVQTPGSELAALLSVPLPAFGQDRAEQLWEAIHAEAPESDPARQPRYRALCRDIERIDWRERKFNTASAMSLIRDMPDGSQHITRQPSGLLGRPRRNSGILAELKADRRSYQPRRFMQVVVNVQPHA